jgi:hypothetical protein
MDPPGRRKEDAFPRKQGAAPLQEIVMTGMSRKYDFSDYVERAWEEREEKEKVDLPGYILKDSRLDCGDMLSYGLEFYARSLTLI